MTADEEMPPELEEYLRSVGFPDEIDRRRHPQVGCYEHASGTWIHGRPHTCPKWTRR